MPPHADLFEPGCLRRHAASVSMTIRDRGRWISTELEREPALGELEGFDGLVRVEDLEWQKWAFAWAASLVESEVGESTWRAFVMTALDDQAPARVAAELQMQVGAVYTAKCRVLARIRAHIQQLSQS